MATNINIDASSKQNYLGTDVNDAIDNANAPNATNPFATLNDLTGGLPTGAIPSNYVSRITPLVISSPTFIDVPSLSTTITVTASVRAYSLFSFEASADGADAIIEFKIIINGEDSDTITVDFTKAGNSNGSINYRTSANLAVGSHIVKVQARKVSGNKIPSLDKGFLFTFALQAPKGDDGATGQGVPIGGTTNQVLSKIDGTDYNTQWITPSGGSLEIGTTPIINGTVNRVLLEGEGNVVNQSPALSLSTNGMLDVQAVSGFEAIKFKSQYTTVGYLGSDGGGAWLSSGVGLTGGAFVVASTIARIRGADIQFLSNVGAEYARFNNVGFFGIGQPNPTARLHVKAADATSNVGFRFEKSNGTGDWFMLENNGELRIFGNTNLIRSYSSASGESFPSYSFAGWSGYGLYSTGAGSIGLSTAGVGRIIINNVGNVGISNTTPTAKLHLPAGTASASTAPIKLTAGTNMTTPENGAIEYDGTDFHITNSTLTRKAIGAKAIQVSSVDVLVGAWTLVGSFYEANISNANILATSIVDIIPENSTINIVTNAELLPLTNSSAGSVKIYAKNAPTGTITVTLNIFN
jgi:hypothetical protein